MAGLPVFILCRDRFESCLLPLIGWLERAQGVERIILVDFDSTYPPLLEYYKQTRHDVHRVGVNGGPQMFWNRGFPWAMTTKELFVLTDPDSVPEPTCPMDAIPYLAAFLRDQPQFRTAALSLRIDDVPEPMATRVREIEQPHWNKRLGSDWYEAPIDTTFAVHRKGSTFTAGTYLYQPTAPTAVDPYGVVAGAGRTARSAPPYTARHTTWYETADTLPPDVRWYASRFDPIRCGGLYMQFVMGTLAQ